MANDRENFAEPAPGGRAIEIWSLVLRHIFLIIFMGAIGTGLGYLYFIKTPPTYSSYTSLLVRNEAKTKNAFQGAFKSDVPIETEQPHALLIVSPLVVGKALEKEIGSPIGSGDDKRQLKDLPVFAKQENPTGYIISRLKASAPLQNGAESREILNLSYRDSDPLVTKAVIDAVVDSYKDFLGDSHRNVSLEVLDLIANARDSLLTQLQDAEAGYTQFRQDTPLLFHGDSKATNVHKDRMSEIESARAKLLILLTERRSELQSITDALNRGGSREAIKLMLQSTKALNKSDSDSAGSPANEIFKLMLEEQLLLLDLGAEHPKVKALQKKISLMQDHYFSSQSETEGDSRSTRGDFISICVAAMNHEIRSLESKVTELDELFERERFASRSIAIYEIKNDTFVKEIFRIEQLYQGVVKRLDELNLLQDYGGYTTAIISPARRGSYVAPVFAQSLLLGAIIGAAAGFGLAYLMEANDKTFRNPEEVIEHLGLPIIGHVPVIERESSGAKSDSAIDQTIVTYHKPKSRLAESYRAIRTSLYFSTRGEKHKVIQITSPNPGDGKTTLSTNLSASIAQSGKRVLLIDADFRRPRLHELLTLDKTIGVSSVISGEAELPDAIQATEIENLWAMPCGPRPDNPCELLTSRRFEELIEILREQYDFVIIDTPPLLAVTDPSAVAPRVDGVILTIRLSKRTRGEATKATALLESVGANALGVVVNGLGKMSGYGYGYGYGYNYGYGSYQYNYQTKYSYGSQDDNPYYADAQEETAGKEGSRSKKRARIGHSDS